MTITLTPELLRLFEQILQEDRSEYEWSLIESDDMFQSENYIGGFDATEMAFCFSYFDSERSEHWFQLELREVRAAVVANGLSIQARPRSGNSL